MSDSTCRSRRLRPGEARHDDRARTAPAGLDERDRAIVLATQDGLPLVPDPWRAVGQAVGLSGSEVKARLQRMLECGVIRRIAAVPNHYCLGYLANGMTVWDVEDAEIDRLGHEIATLPGVSHCYRRPRHRPHWPYNLFVMLHGHSREEVERQAEAIHQRIGAACRDHRILYSSRILKKTGLRLAGRSDRPG
ncbi:Lrp/AsnC family transcriptional regulator [Halomonas sp. C05BenzN]|uniref:siroheme decarboxylase subunit beta n=1 Tax=Halomonas sp. C05BenzN TaxID=3411041 RepID=UPI003B94E837